MKKITIGLMILGIVFLAIILVSAYNFNKLYKSEWVCIAQECSEYATGDDWVKQNCKLQDNEMICEFQYEGEFFRVPLSGVNISRMVSCKQYECSSKVLISYSNKFREEK